MTAHGLLPFITQPSRVVESQTPSLIDNIFSTNISDGVQSGNIFLTLSEHFSQFASVNRGSIDVKKITIPLTKKLEKYNCCHSVLRGTARQRQFFVEAKTTRRSRRVQWSEIYI